MTRLSALAAAIGPARASRIVLALGALLAVAGAWKWWDGERTFGRMRPTTCTVVSRKVETDLLVSGKRRKTLRYREEAHLVLSHTLDGGRYEFTEDFVRDWALYATAGFEEGKTYPCRYDPEDPRRGTVRRAFDSDDSLATLALGALIMMLAAAIPRWWRRPRP